MKRHVITGFLLSALALVALVPALSVYAQDVTEKTVVTAGPVQQVNKYFSTQTFVYSDGTSISRNVIGGPPTPPPGYEIGRAEVALPEPNPAAGTATLPVPAYTWVFGCSAVSGSMIAAYYDRNGFPNIYTGPTGGGVMPLTEDASWGTWSDGVDTYPNNPLIASHDGLDGRTTRGSIDDYWIQYGSTASDPYITGAWTQHTWGTAIGDYMKTSQSAYGNTDGSTTFYTWTSSASQLTCVDMEVNAIDTVDGTYGRKLFYEARGYTVTDCYNQKTDNNGGGFTFAMYKAEIDAGRPVLLNLAGHSIVGVGYDDSTSPETVYIHDTWDHLNHTMTWGGSYSGMQLLSVSVVNIEESSCTYTISSSSKTFPANGASAGVTIKATGAATCPQPDLVPSESWITAAFNSAGWKKNKGTAKITVAKSATSLERIGSVAIADQTYTITQKPVICTIKKLYPASLSFPVGGGSGAFDITLSAEDCAWTTLSNVGWVSPDGSGTGSATVNYTVGVNDAGKARSGKITVTLANGKTRPHTVRQQK